MIIGSLFKNPKSQKHIPVKCHGDHNNGDILIKGSKGNTSTFTISKVMLVEGLRHGLLSITQLCDNGYKATFAKYGCIIVHNEKKECMFNSVRIDNICYT